MSGIRRNRSGSTSFHRLNGDTKLRLGKKFMYLGLNFINNLFPNSHLDPEVEIRHFGGGISLEHYWDRLGLTFSPARKWSDLFWLTLPWGKINKELGHLRVLDIGCGSGEYGQQLETLSAHGLESYVGLDIKSQPNWQILQAKYSHFSFHHADISESSNWIPSGTNLIISQSALEHMESDIHILKRIRHYANNYTDRKSTRLNSSH